MQKQDISVNFSLK